MTHLGEKQLSVVVLKGCFYVGTFYMSLTDARAAFGKATCHIALQGWCARPVPLFRGEGYIVASGGCTAWRGPLLLCGGHSSVKGRACSPAVEVEALRSGSKSCVR